MNKDADSHTIIKETGFSLLAEGKIIRVRADGYSMYPAIKPGSVILIEPFIEEMNPMPGEILAWKRESGFVVHRLVSIIKNDDGIMFKTRGDSCSFEDQPVSGEQVAGRVTSVETSSGKILKSGNELIQHPAYLYNRLMIWILLKCRRILLILHLKKR
jgi:signal peptidase I